MNKLSDETMIEILMYLRATELATLTETNKEFFSRYRVGMAIQRIIKESPTLINTTSPFKKHILRIQQAKGLLRPESLYVFEVANILSALTFPQPLFGKGYWISASWASNAKKYFEAVPMGDMVENALLSLQMPSNTASSATNTPTPQKGHKNAHKQLHGNRSGESSPVVIINASFANTPQKTPLSNSFPSSPAPPTTPTPNNITGSSSPAVPLSTPKQHPQPLQLQRSFGKSSKIRQRRGSDALPPWPNMNAELTCVHNGLSSHKIPNAKRKAMAGVAWRILRRYYPIGEAFHIAHIQECAQCLSQTDEAKQLAQEKKESTLQMRKKQWCPPTLQALYQRAKQGVPSDRLVSSHHMYLLEELDEDGQVVHYETVALPSSALGQAASLPPLPPSAANSVPNVPATTFIANDSRSESPVSSTTTAHATTGTTTTDAIVSVGTVANQNESSFIPNLDDADNSVGDRSSASAVGGIRESFQNAGHWPIQLPEFTYPLLPGVYYLIPRDWLKNWRRFIKDATVTQAPQLTPVMDCTRLLCHRHGHLLVPHHLEEYLVGIKRSLLTGLGEYLGEVVEIVTAEEWETLATICHNVNHNHTVSFTDAHEGPVHASSPLSRARSSDFSVSFTIDVSSRNDGRLDEVSQQQYQLEWNIPVCHVCDPLDMVREANTRTWR